MTYEEFKTDILSKVKQRPKFIRKGQAVFNLVSDVYGVARAVQFEDGIDCFYNDSAIEDFLTACYKRLQNYETT